MMKLLFERYVPEKYERKEGMKEKVYALVCAVPKGKVTTYGQIAEALGNKNLARAVGNALHQNPDPASIPCHRVVSSKGRLATHYAFGGAEAQRSRLEAEGITFRTDGTVDLLKYGF